MGSESVNMVGLDYLTTKAAAENMAMRVAELEQRCEALQHALVHRDDIEARGFDARVFDRLYSWSVCLANEGFRGTRNVWISSQDFLSLESSPMFHHQPKQDWQLEEPRTRIGLVTPVGMFYVHGADWLPNGVICDRLPPVFAPPSTATWVTQTALKPAKLDMGANGERSNGRQVIVVTTYDITPTSTQVHE